MPTGDSTLAPSLRPADSVLDCQSSHHRLKDGTASVTQNKVSERAIEIFRQSSANRPRSGDSARGFVV